MFLQKIQKCRALLVSPCMIVALVACARAKPVPPPPPAPEVSVFQVHRTSIPVTIMLPGRTSAYLSAQVRARVDGIVQKRSFVEGSQVKEGQLLYQIDPAPYRVALESADATLKKAQANLATMTAQLERYKILIQGNAVSKQSYDNAVAAQRQADADVAAGKAATAAARINLGYTHVVSPIAGRSGISQVTQGAYVQGSAATLLTTVQQIDPIYVDLQQSSTEGLRLRHDVASGLIKLHGPSQAKVTLTLEDGSIYPLSGTLDFSGMTVDPGTGSTTLRAVFPNPQNVLLPGMFVRAGVMQGVNANAMLVPVSGVAHDPQGQATVMVVGPDSKVAARTVQAKSMVGADWVVESGLNDGDKVIVSGAQKVQPGMLVRATQPAPATPPITESGAPTAPRLPQSNTAGSPVAASGAN